MKGKRLLTLVLMVCMLISVMSPAAGAVHIAADEITMGGLFQGGTSASSDRLNNLIASGDKANIGNTLRDDKSHVNKYVDITLRDGQWIATAIDGTTAVLTDAELPDHIKKLREASDHYNVADIVPAFVVLEDAPTAEQYGTITEVPEEETAQLAQQQDALIDTIEDEILDGEALNVITQFTYLTNAVVVETEFGNLEQIAALDGVKSVFLSPVYSPSEVKEVMYPATVSSSQMTGVANVWKDLGYTGSGMTIAILDTGLDVDHQSFAADPALGAGSWTMESLQTMLDTYELNCEVLYDGTLTADDLYYSAKVPFTFHYSSRTTNVGHADGIGDHGTHVAGIAAANRVEGTGVVGMAPDAQIIAMKVFSSETGGAYMFDILRALEDSMILGVDVVNMSLGSPAGFAVTEIEEIDNIYARICETDIIVDIAAGNEATSSYGSAYGPYMQTTTNIDNATISSPSTYRNVLSIASVDNLMVYASYFSLADGEKIFYMPSVEYLYEYIDYSLDILAGQDIEYVMVPGLGEIDDFYDENGNSIVEGKIAVISRGSISFGEKSFNAQAAGAVGALIWDNVSEDIFNFGMTTSMTDEEGNEIYPEIPVALISLESGQIMAAAETKIMNVSAEDGTRTDVNGGQMSQFSCWGVSPELYLLPDMTGVGGNVYSCYDGSEYGLMSGTSMATPQVAGVTALVLQYLKGQFPDADAATIRELVYGLMMSTAVPVIDNATGLEASPRQQGAGLVDAKAAITAGAYLTVPGNDRTKAELFDSEDGVYNFSFVIHNFSDAAKTYSLSSSLLCEDYVTDDNYPGVYFMAEYDHELDSNAVSFDKKTVTVAAGQTATVHVTINLTEADKNWIDTYFPSGNYVEGFVYLEGEDEVTLSLPFLGFYGRWDAAPLFDTGYWYDEGFWTSVYTDVIPDGVDANEYYHILWANITGSDWVLGLNPYEGVQIDENGKVVYSDTNNVLSPNGDGAMDLLTEFYVSLMRNAEEMYFVYTDEAGNVLHEEKMEKESKTMFVSGYGSVVPFVYTWYYDNLYDFTDAQGNYLPDGSTVYLTISGVISYEGAEVDVLNTFPIHIDTAAPELDADSIVESTDEDGNHFLTLTFTEEHPAFLATMNLTGTQIYNRYSEMDMVNNEDGTYSIIIDVTGLGDNFSIVLGDYGCNEAYYNLSWSESGANNPEVDYDALYAYQVYNEYIYYYYGWDYMFGWATIDKNDGTVEMLQSDAYEYYALSAAEYAGGYVFAVDAGYNLIYMEPGLWNRYTICNLGINVVDMAFDEVTETMYLTSKTDDAYGLYTVDLLTGELTLLHAYESHYFMPWAMTFVDGELYACKYFYNGFYKVDLEGETYELIPVTMEDGSQFIPKDSVGTKTSAMYSQSMTYSEKDGLIYWAYYSTNSCDLIVIDPKTWTYRSVAFGFDQEYVGVLTLEDGGYVLPESSEVTKLVISDDQVILPTNSNVSLTATPLPWNAPAGAITWESADERIATVNENGVVTAISEGETTITAYCDGYSVSCNVVVVDVSGSLNAYNYFSGDNTWGNWLSIDLKDITATDLAASDVDFIAADYNGHNGLIYGFSEYGQYYSFDPATGETTLIGNGGSAVPADMAYDYSTGNMYAVVYDFTSWRTTLYSVSPSSGKMIRVAAVDDVFITWACDTEGTFYGINYDGQLYRLTLDGASLTPEFVMQTPVEMLFYAQSMCYDHNNDVILWASVEGGTLYWIDPNNSTPYALALGEPSGSGYIEYVGMHVIPEEIPERATVGSTSLECEDTLMLVGEYLKPAVTIYPVNATVQDDLTYTSTDTSVVEVVDGQLHAVGEGTATIRVRNTSGRRCTFTVTVKKSTGDLHAFLLSDVATMDGYYWMSMNDMDPMNYQGVEYVYYNGTYMLLYAAEYVDGYIYAYGYDYDDWYANFHYLIIDAKTRAVLSATDMGDNFGFVYDMAFDYTTGTMYALCGPSDTASDLYYVDLETGELIGCMLTDPMFMSLAVDGNGTIYAMEGSNADDAGSTAKLYVLDVENGTCEVLMDTGVGSNMLASMAYDYDTGYLYWTGFASGDTGYESGLYLIDLEELACYNLGTIGQAGAQVTALMSFSDNYPEIPSTLQGLTVISGREELAVGDSVALQTFLRPAGIDVELSWTSDNETVATVDQNGIVTAVSAGTAIVTVRANDAGKTFAGSCEIIVYGEDDYFITYNATEGGFSAIGRPDSTIVTELTSGDEEAPVSSMVMHDGVIYAYDTNGDLFITAEDADFLRTYIGNCGIEVEEGYTSESINSYYEYYYTYEYTFVIRDMAWDAQNNRLLALGCHGMTRDTEMVTVSTGEVTTYTDTFEMTGGCKIYEVDLQTGALTELLTVGGSEQPEAGVTMFEITPDGTAYVYSYFMDYVSIMDMQTGELSFLTTFQNQGVYGGSDGELMAMTYDSFTNCLYMLFTQNGKIYYLFKFDCDTGAINLVDSVGQIVSKYTDSFAGLVLSQEHECEYVQTGSQDASCTEEGYVEYTCTEHGVIKHTDVVPAHGHNAQAVVTAPTCTEQGYTTHTCNVCGEVWIDSYVDALGHDNQNGECSRCDAKFATISKQPVSVTVGAGEKATVTVEATGDGLNYTWFYSDDAGKTFVHTSTFDGSNTYSVKMNESRSGRLIYCVITDAYGSEVTSDIVMISMTGHLKITEQPESVSVGAGEKATVTVAAIGDGLTYTWYYSDNGGKTFRTTDAFTGNTYSVVMKEARAGRLIYCVITDAYGNEVQTDVVEIGMSGYLKITGQPESVTVKKDQKATVTVVATGEGLTYKWFFSDDGGKTFNLTTAFTGDTYSLRMNASRSGRLIYCVITDAYGNEVKSDVVMISMTGHLKITAQPEGVTVEKGQMATVTVGVIGDDLTYTWFYSDNGGKSFKVTNAFHGNSYYVSMNEARAGRMIYCVITDKNGNQVQTETVMIGMTGYLKIVGQPEDDTAAAGEKVSVTVVATGEGLSFTWFYSDNGGKTFTSTDAFDGHTYAVTMNAKRDGRQIYCVVTDAYGNEVVSDIVTLSMN